MGILRDKHVKRLHKGDFHKPMVGLGDLMVYRHPKDLDDRPNDDQYPGGYDVL